MVLTVVEKPRKCEIQSFLCLFLWQVTSSPAAIADHPVLVFVSVVISCQAVHWIWQTSLTVGAEHTVSSQKGPATDAAGALLDLLNHCPSQFSILQPQWTLMFQGVCWIVSFSQFKWSLRSENSKCLLWTKRLWWSGLSLHPVSAVLWHCLPGTLLYSDWP